MVRNQGNIIFTDHEYRILALLRNVPATDTLNIAVGEIYNVQTVLTDFEKVQVDQLRTALRSAGPKDTLKKLLNIKFGKVLLWQRVKEARSLLSSQNMALL